MPEFRKINFGARELGDTAVQNRLRGLMRPSASSPGRVAAPAELSERLTASTPETAGRLYLQTYLEDTNSEELLALTEPDSPQSVPQMQLEGVTNVPALSAENVTFQQTYKTLPIFSGRISIDVDQDDRALVSINGQLAPLPDIDPVERISALEAVGRLAEWAGVDVENAVAATLGQDRPSLEWFLDEKEESWHLVHHFKSVAIDPPDDSADGPSHDFLEVPHFCVGHSPRAEKALYDYMVDGHTGKVVFYYSSSPRIDIPVPMQGEDAAGDVQTFFGLHGGGQFLLNDPIRKLKTYDLAHQDLDGTPAPSIPNLPISNKTNDLGNSHPAAVAAHKNATLVYDFFNDILKRDSLDDKGMTLVSIVNAYASQNNPEPHPNWLNAVWWRKAMWYGQVNGTSLAEHLDVIAHELTHGVTETSSNLIYRRLPGALNESFSDIFGIVIKNWYPSKPEPLITWNWDIGAGLRPGGGPLRGFADPAAAGQPDHFSQYVVLPISQDQGGVHIYSGIHNRAVHLLLTNTDGADEPTFPIQEAILLLYLTLTRLTPTSDFSDCRRTLENVVQAYHISDPATMSARLQAIDAAYGAVGII
ncbi:M4 family metallopeptidase [Rhodobacteraceae bacterium]|nr:M4 family metallopeptidase [Paracoccaceae bacterium]